MIRDTIFCTIQRRTPYNLCVYCISFEDINSYIYFLIHDRLLSPGRQHAIRDQNVNPRPMVLWYLQNDHTNTNKIHDKAVSRHSLPCIEGTHSSKVATVALSFTSSKSLPPVTLIVTLKLIETQIQEYNISVHSASQGLCSMPIWPCRSFQTWFLRSSVLHWNVTQACLNVSL